MHQPLRARPAPVQGVCLQEELARLAAEEKPLFDESVFSGNEPAPDAPSAEPTGPEDVPMPEGNIFAGFDELVDPEGERPAEEPPAPKVDPFAGSGLDD